MLYVLDVSHCGVGRPVAGPTVASGCQVDKALQQHGRFDAAAGYHSRSEIRGIETDLY